MAILLGTVLDGIPESIVFGVSLLGGGGVSVAMLAAVFLSNLPEALSSYTLSSSWNQNNSNRPFSSLTSNAG
jgi:hypothetical protein